MQAKRFAEAVSLIAAVVGMVLAANHDFGLRTLGFVLAGGSALWYFKVGQRLSGWVGPDHATLLADIARAEGLLRADLGSENLERKLAEARRRLHDFEAAREPN